MRSLFSAAADPSDARFRGWLLYDRDCAFCTRCARALEPALLARGFHVAALQDSWVAAGVGLAARRACSSALSRSNATSGMKG